MPMDGSARKGRRRAERLSWRTVKASWVLAGAIAVLALAWLLRASWLQEPEALPAGCAHGASMAAALLGDAAAPAPESDQPADAQARTAAGSAAPGRRIRVRAVIEPDQSIAADAEVLYWPARTESQRTEDLKAMTAPGDLESSLRRTGRVVLTDEHGVAELHAAEDSTVCARLGDYYGELELSWNTAPFPVAHCIEMQRDVTLQVQVLDASGAVCPGLDVEGRATHASRRRGEVAENVFTVGMTDARGIATLRHLQRAAELPGDDVIDWALDVACRGEHLASIRRRVDLGDLFAAAPVRLVIPAGGTVIVELVDADGRPCFDMPCLCDPTSNLVCTPTDGGWRYSHTFRNVPRGRTWTIGGKAGETMFAATVVGPVTAGEIVRTRVEVDQRRFSIVGRVRRADGIPLEGAAISAQAPGATNEHNKCYTNVEGRFGWETVLPATVAMLTGARVVVEHRSMAAPHTIAIAQALGQGKTDLGDLVVPVPAGETLLATVEVRCEGRPLTEQVDASLTTVEGRTTHLVPARRVLADGAFAFHGVPPSLPMQLSVLHPDYLDRGPMPVALGERVVVELARAAELWVSCVPPSVPDPMLCAKLFALDGSGDLSANGGPTQFAWWRARPGRYRLVVRAEPRLVHEEPVIELHAGLNQWPADGSAIDLRGRAVAVFVPVAAADDRQPVPDLRRAVVPAGATEVSPDNPYPDVTDWLVVPEQPMDLLIAAPGFVPQRLPHPTADQRVWLRRCTTLQFQPPAGEPRTVVVRIVEDAVRDAALRAFDASNRHETWDFETEPSPTEVAFAPGTVLELVVSSAGAAQPPMRITVGDASPQPVPLR
jgi:hypothetical protein